MISDAKNIFFDISSILFFPPCDNYFFLHQNIFSYRKKNVPREKMCGKKKICGKKKKVLSINTFENISVSFVERCQLCLALVALKISNKKIKIKIILKIGNRRKLANCQTKRRRAAHVKRFYSMRRRYQNCYDIEILSGRLVEP